MSADVLDRVFPVTAVDMTRGDHYVATGHLHRYDCCECRLLMNERETALAKWYGRWGGQGSMSPAVMEAARVASIEALGQAT